MSHVLDAPITTAQAQEVLAMLRRVGVHEFLTDDVSIIDRDVPRIAGHRQVTDAHLLTLARRHGRRLVTFDRAILALGGSSSVELLSML